MSLEKEELDATAAKRVTEGPLTKGIILFGIPMVLAMTLHGGFNLVDAYFVGLLDNASIPQAVIGICDPLLMVATIAANGICTASVAVVSRFVGANQPQSARHAAAQSIWLVAAICLMAGVAGALFARPIGGMMGAKGAVLDLTAEYLRLMFGGVFTIVFLLQLTAILRAGGDAKGPAIAMIFANVLNVVVDPFLMFGWAGLPEMGLMGAAWATVGARFVGCLLAFWYIYKSPLKLWPSGKEWRIDKPIMKELVKIGAPNSLQLVVRVAALLGLVALVAHSFATESDQTKVAAFGIGVRIDMFILMGASGWGAAAATYVGQNLGAGKPERAMKAGWIAGGLGVAMFGVISVLIFGFASPIVALFAEESSAVHVAGVEYLNFVSLSLGLGGGAVILALALNGAGSTKAPLAIDFLAFALLIIPFACIAVLSLGYGWQAVLIAVAGANVVLAVVYAFWFRLGRWQKVEIE